MKETLNKEHEKRKLGSNPIKKRRKKEGTKTKTDKKKKNGSGASCL